MVAGAYAGRARVTGVGDVGEVQGLRRLVLVAGATPEPITFDGSDDWDRRFLGEAIAFGDRLEALARGYTSDLAGRGTLGRVLPVGAPRPRRGARARGPARSVPTPGRDPRRRSDRGAGPARHVPGAVGGGLRVPGRRRRLGPGRPGPGLQLGAGARHHRARHRGIGRNPRLRTHHDVAPTPPDRPHHRRPGRPADHRDHDHHDGAPAPSLRWPPRPGDRPRRRRCSATCWTCWGWASPEAGRPTGLHRDPAGQT